MNALERDRLLLIDTCGETAGVAVCVGRDVVAAEDLSRGQASVEIVAAVRRLLKGVGWRLAELHAVGVVSGPGSFTGLRTGLAAAKGLCEAAELRLVGVSRLAVLASAAGATQGLVALDAGRGEVYAREVVSGREWMCGDADVLAAQISLGKDNVHPAGDGEAIGGLVVAEERLAERLKGGRPVLRPLHVGDAVEMVLRKLRSVQDSAKDGLDANYVRGELDIYRKAGEPARRATTEA